MNNFFPMIRSNTMFPEDRLLKNFFNGFPEMKSNFAMDIKDDGDHFTLEAELAGFQKEDVKIHYKDKVLTISAKRNEEKSEEKEDGKYMIRERSRQSFQRQIVAENIKEEDISATMADGVLIITLPKADQKDLPGGRDIVIN